MGEITLKGFMCERCGHKWVPIKENAAPKVCPRCKSPYWDRPRTIKPSPKVAEVIEKYARRRGSRRGTNNGN
jgi:hypothetical protein